MKQSTYANIRDEKNTRLCTPLLQFFSTRFARINLLTRAWFDREKGGCPFRIQYKTRRIHLSPLSLSLSPPAVSLSFLSFFVWVSRDDLRCSSTPTERKRESNVDRWRRVCSWRSRIFLQREIDTRESISRMTHRYGKEIRIGLLNRYPWILRLITTDREWERLMYCKLQLRPFGEITYDIKQELIICPANRIFLRVIRV